MPEPRSSEPGATTLLRTIVGQQVSVAAARSMWAKLEAAFGSPPDLEQAARRDATRNCARRACRGRRRATSAASRSWCCPASSTSTHLPEDDEEAIALLTKIKGIGRWSAEIYLLFAEGRRDVFPAGDLAVHDRDRPAAGPRRTSRARSSCASSPSAGGRIAAPPRCSPGTATIQRGVVDAITNLEEPDERTQSHPLRADRARHPADHDGAAVPRARCPEIPVLPAGRVCRHRMGLRQLRCLCGHHRADLRAR